MPKKTYYVVLQIESEIQDIVELDGQLYQFEYCTRPENVSSMSYWHVSERGYIEVPAKKKKQKKKG